MTTTAKWPAALAALADFGADMPNMKTAVLSGAHNNSITTITLTATVPTEWPTAGWVTIDGEIIKYAGKSGATLTSCTRGDQSAYGGGVAASHSDQAIVGPYLTAQQVNQVFAEIIALEKWEGNATPVATIASSGTTDLSTLTSRYAQVTGTTTITAFGTVNFTRLVILEFAGILTLTHNATSLIMRSGANATTAAGDVYAFVSEGSGNWREIWHLAATSDLTSDQLTNYHTFLYSPLGAPAGTAPGVITNVGTGTTTILGRGHGVQLNTGATNPSSTSVRSHVTDSVLTETAFVSKVRRMAFACGLNTFTNANAHIYLTSEDVDTIPTATPRHLGVKYLNGTVSFTTGDGTTEQTTAITSFVTGATVNYFVVTFDGTTAKCYIDGVLRATHATNVPTGGSGSVVLRAFINNNSTASNVSLNLMQVEALVANS